ncbi:MAG: hypothetical protein GX663_04575 [Clostridiales bacterium]|nr:hypothetical protein [Clostridiales bacterium]
MEVTELIFQQGKTFCVMLAAGILTESLWHIKKRWSFPMAIGEILYWAMVAVIVTMFLYYSSFGQVSFHGMLGFFTGLLLWKKICCDIISPWVKTGEAKSTKAAAASSAWRKPGRGGLKKDGRKSLRKRSARVTLQASRPEEKEPLEKAKTDGG